MNFFDNAFHHVGCVMRMVRGETEALSDMDISADGFWRSFEAIPAALPAMMFGWVAEARQLRDAGSLDPIGSMIARMAVLEVVFWILPVIAFAFVLRPLNLSRRFSHLIVTRNWLAVLTSYIFVLVPLSELILSGGGSTQLTFVMTLAAMVLALWFSVRITRIALAVTPMVALAFVAVEVVITYPLAVSAYAASGLYPPA